MEHFAVNAALRGAGYGSRLLRELVAAHKETVLLEIDPLTDEVSRARYRFYLKCGFHSNPYPHTHPPYREGYAPHPLVLLTSAREITAQEYLQFQSDLTTVVMGK